MSEHNIYRDGKVHVMAEQCATCIFNPHTRPVEGKRVAEMVRETIDTDASSVVCHHTLYNPGPQRNAVCRGWWDRLADKDPIMRLAKAMNVVHEQEVDCDQPDRPGAVSEYGVEISEEEFNNRCGEKP